MSDSLRPHGLKHAKLQCPPLYLGVCSESCPLSPWCYVITSSSAALFSFCLLSFPASGSFPMCQLFTSGGQSTETSASALVLSMNIQGWFPLGLTGLISAVQGTLKRLLQHHYSKASILQRSAFIIVQLLNLYLATGKSMALTIWAFVGKVMSRLFHTLSRFIIASLPRS